MADNSLPNSSREPVLGEFRGVHEEIFSSGGDRKVNGQKLKLKGGAGQRFAVDGGMDCSILCPVLQPLHCTLGLPGQKLQLTSP